MYETKVIFTTYLPIIHILIMPALNPPYDLCMKYTITTKSDTILKIPNSSLPSSSFIIVPLDITFKNQHSS